MTEERKNLGARLLAFVASPPWGVVVAFAVCLAFLFSFPPAGGYVWEPLFINASLACLFALFVWLTARLAGTDRTSLGLLFTAVFLLAFCPGAHRFFQRDEVGLMELGSQSIVPFFMGQFQRIRRRDFHRIYTLMLLMGIFCSYTHNGITIPMCVAFLVVSLRHGRRFFRRACWPMVLGVCVGTALSVWQHRHDVFTPDIDVITSRTALALRTLWDTKVFLLSVLLTAYLSAHHKGRRMLLYTARRHFMLSFCALAALIILPFAPLGLDNAIDGVCFFHMFWLLFLSRYLLQRVVGYRL